MAISQYLPNEAQQPSLLLADIAMIQMELSPPVTGKVHVNKRLVGSLELLLL